MALSLYRKWRPQKFSEVFGQKHIKTILKNALKSQKISHAYIFSGPRGVGKTTVARILAKTLNCVEPNDGESCGKCANCQAHLQGANMDLLEIDAASNRGIDEIRNLIEKIKFTPTQSQYKVFIIDEAHMLTKEAWNALLKTLEEPPLHAIFVLVTTEPHRIPATIHSRCQRLDFKRINTQDMLDRLREIARAEKILIEDLALVEIMRNARGGLRDAVSLLDQIQTFVGKKVTLLDVEMLLGIANKKIVEEFLEHLNSGNQQAAFLKIEELLEEGADLEHFLEELINLVRIGLKIKLGLSGQMLDDFGKEQISELEKFFADFQISRLLKILKTLIEVRRSMKDPDILELPLELAVLDLAKDAVSPAPVPEKTITPLIKTPETSTKKVSLDEVKENWLVILEKLKAYNHSLFSLVKSMLPLEISENQLVLGTTFKFYKDKIMHSKNREIICKVLTEVLETNLGIHVKLMDQKDLAKNQDTQKFLQEKNNQKENEFLENVQEVFEKE